MFGKIRDRQVRILSKYSIIFLDRLFHYYDQLSLNELFGILRLPTQINLNCDPHGPSLVYPHLTSLGGQVYSDGDH